MSVRKTFVALLHEEMRKNEDRAAAGREAMDFYSEQIIGYDKVVPPMSSTRKEPAPLVDLLTDLMHAYGHRAVRQCSRIALEHYEFEISYEEEEEEQ